MSFNVLVKLICLFVVVNTQSIDWCTMQNCAVNSHVACNNNGAFYGSCITPNAVPFTTAQKQQLLNVHNTYRNQIASGTLSPFSTAGKMPQLIWNDQLAWLAELNTKQCKMAHDACRNTPNFKYSGQNLAIMMTTASYSIESAINGSMSMWFNEYANANMNDINTFSSTSSSGKVIGHFTALVQDRTTQVGCAMSTFKTMSGTTSFNSYLLACNYASTNILGCKVYRTGTPAQYCTLGPDATYPALCKTTEPIDPNTLC